MGYEYLTQPQIFLAPITATNGIYGINEAWPLLTTYQSWTSTASVNASAFPIPGTWTMLNNSGSFLVTVGGVLQQPSEYTVNSDFRTLTFNSLISAGVEIGVQQLATAAPSSQNFNNLTSVSATFQSLSSRTGIFDTLLVTNLTGLSTVVNIIDVRISEVSGFRSTGNVDIQGSANITGNMNLSGSLSVGTDITTPTITVTDATATGLTATNATITNLIATGATMSNATLLGTTSAILINTNLLSAREIDLIHEPSNDGIDPILDIGETTSTGFSGFRVRYQESSNRLLVQTVASSLTSNSVIIDRATGQVGISAVPNQALTVVGNISATGIAQVSSVNSQGVFSSIISGGNIYTQAPITVTSTPYTVPTLASTIIYNNTNTTGVFTLPSASTNAGRWLYIRTVGAAIVSSATANIIPLSAAQAGTPIITILPQTGTVAANKWTQIQSDGTNWVTIAAN